MHLELGDRLNVVNMIRPVSFSIHIVCEILVMLTESLTVKQTSDTVSQGQMPVST